jgi:site-specific DNA-methyltransferase (cytosine-N4-specific)
MNICHFGDCRDTMRRLIADGVKVQMCVTSPPYFGLRDYGHPGQIGLEQTPAEYVAAMVEVFGLVRELMADDGVLWLNLGDSYCSIGHKKSGSGYWTTGLAGGKAQEHTPLRRENNVPGLKHKDLIGIPWRVAFALQADGWYLRQDIIWAKPNPMPESVTDRCTKSHEYIFLLSKSERYFYDAESIKEESITNDPRRPYGSKGAWDMDGRPDEQKHGGEPRSYKGSKFHTGKTGDHQLGRAQKVRAPVNMKRGEFNGKTNAMPGREAFRAFTETRNRRSVWTVATVPYGGAHFATFPPALIEPCILAGSRPGDTVLDPFFGSGTTGQVAQALGRQWIGCEIQTEYENLQRRRTAQTGMVLHEEDKRGCP